MRYRAPSLLSLLLVVGPAPPSERLHAGSRAQETTANYLDIVHTYRRGEVDEAMEELSGKAPQSLLALLGTWKDERHTDAAALRPGDETLRAAAVMHTDLAMRVAEDLEFHSADVQLEIAEQLIERIRDSGERERFRRDWLLALGYFYQGSVFSLGVLDGFERARRYYDDAVKRFPDDAQILLSAGTLYEWAGSLKYGAEEHLEKAEELYRLAIHADPKVAEAHLRYGRVLVKRGDDLAAEPSLREALELRGSPFVRYVAQMMLGGIAERKNDLETAMASYRAAMELEPRWETAYVALSHALHIAGRSEESARVLESTLEATVTSPEDFDGWMVYESGHSKRLDVLWSEMREEVSY